MLNQNGADFREDKVNNILYQYHDNVQSSKETLYQDFINFKDKPKEVFVWPLGHMKTMLYGHRV